MHKTSRFKIDIGFAITFFIMFLISIVSLYSASNILPSYQTNVFFKQLIWFGIGIGLVIIVMNLGIDYFYRHARLLYIINIILLISVLLWGKDVNGARAWFEIPLLGSFQPSEFMKISLILMLSVKIDEFNNMFHSPTIDDELKFIISCIFITFIPSILTFLEPDTGAVIFYLVILFGMLFISGIRKRWFIIGLSTISIITLLFISLYFLNNDLFINLFGTNSFYRIDRLLNWTNGEAFQLKNAMASMGSAGFWGNGLQKIPIYFPEANTDFIFAVWVSTFGLIGAVILISTLLFFDVKIISLANITNKNLNLYLIAGIISVIIFSQIINIGMTLGLFPIIGVTLPFISYGGSSLLSYMIMLGLILTINNENIRYTN